MIKDFKTAVVVPEDHLLLIVKLLATYSYIHHSILDIWRRWVFICHSSCSCQLHRLTLVSQPQVLSLAALSSSVVMSSIASYYSQLGNYIIQFASTIIFSYGSQYINLKGNYYYVNNKGSVVSQLGRQLEISDQIHNQNLSH